MIRFCCFVMIFTFLFSPAFTVHAAEKALTDSASYVEKTTGDTIDMEIAIVSENAANQKRLSDEAYVTHVYRNGAIEEVLYVDFDNNILRHEFADGSVAVEALSDVVTVSSVSPSEDDDLPNDLSDVSKEGNTRVDYIDNEPLSVSSSGAQSVLAGASTYSGYQAMGYRGGYYYAPTTFGYLQRRNAGVAGTYYSRRFEFTAGTTISTAASIIYACINGAGIGGIVLSAVLGILGQIIDDIILNWSTVFEVKTYKWQYRLRLNSNTGTIIYSNYRTMDYWKSYNPATGAVIYTYRGSAYDQGFLFSNTEMIKAGIDSYLEG